ncbi:hypothetical protein [Tumebacillus lipolyticus]|uniref:Uncharacterized protein n=1 Tax=Tumebacillus lipolyticus TaxID=1280370 RepID=A0ABW5A3A2_9BACL
MYRKMPESSKPNPMRSALFGQLMVQFGILKVPYRDQIGIIKQATGKQVGTISECSVEDLRTVLAHMGVAS